MSQMAVDFYKGYTHTEFVMPATSPLAGHVGRWARYTLQEREFNPRFKRWEPKKNSMYALNDEKTNRFHVPVAFTSDVIAVMGEWGAQCIEHKLPDYELGELGIQMRPEFSDLPHQVKLIQQCSEKTPGMKVLAMQTGKGKTYSAIKCAVNLGYPVMVIVDGLVDQWIDKGASSFLNCTTINADDLYRIQGFESIALLMQNPQYRPKVFVASLTTMQLYSVGRNDYDLLPLNYAQFFQYYGIGTKIVDECHMNFHANTIMDLRSNVPYNLYCSATPTQSSKQARAIFERIFPERLQFGLDAYDKYVTTYFYNFSGEVMERKCVRQRGYQHIRYEADLLKSDRKLTSHINQMFLPMINQYFIPNYKPGRKMLIFCSTIQFIDAVVGKLQAAYPEMKVGKYIGGSNMGDLQELDIIVTTPGKGGTGLDLKGLIVVYNTVSMAAPALSPQLFGRLRKVDDIDVVYIDRCDTNLASQCRHARIRKEMLRRLSLKFREYNGLCDLRIF